MGIGRWAWRVREAREPSESFIRRKRDDLISLRWAVRGAGRPGVEMEVRISVVWWNSSGRATLPFQSSELVSTKSSAMLIT